MRVCRGALPFGLLLLLFTIPFAQADTIYLKSGARFDGELVEKTSTHYVFRIRGIGVQRFPVGDVLRVEAGRSVFDEYEERRKAVEPDDAAGQYELGQWCVEHGLEKKARTAFLAVIGIDPEHAGARKALGYRKVRGKWIREKAYAELVARQEEELDRVLDGFCLP